MKFISIRPEKPYTVTRIFPAGFGDNETIWKYKTKKEAQSQFGILAVKQEPGQIITFTETILERYSK
jgi:hypothetical protein